MKVSKGAVLSLKEGDDLYVQDFVELFLKLYKKVGYVNPLEINIKNSKGEIVSKLEYTNEKVISCKL